jgi:uncharacterized protein YfdQ (DUF2303 family)
MSENETSVAAVANTSDAAVIVDAATAATEPIPLDRGALLSLVVPAGGRHELLDLESYLEAPTRPRATYNPSDVASFMGLVETHEDKAATTVWVHETEGKIVAVLDDNASGKPAWGDHRVVLDLVHSPEWQLWAEHDGKLMSQEQFAEHLREGMPDVTRPDAATLIEVAENFEATTGVHFRSKVDFNSGAKKFKYDEETKATATTAAGGEIEVPRQFELALSPFLGEEPVALVANLRHNSRSGSLQLGYKLERPERAVEDALLRIAERLDDRFERVYRGTPA